MPLTARAAEALTRFTEAFRSGRAAHAYLIAGPPRGEAGDLATAIGQTLFCTAPEDRRPCDACVACRQMRERSYTDLCWIEPRSKARAITIERVREEILPFLGQKSYVGGWKLLVIDEADCLNVAASNALLKSLEEPAPRTLILLVTGAPQQLLPTILSRCQRILLAEAPDDARAVWRQRTADLLARVRPESAIGAVTAAAGLAGLIEEARKTASSETDEGENPVDGEDGDGGDDEDAGPVEDILSKDAKVREARAGARARGVQRVIVQALIEWQRDVLYLVEGGAPEGLRFPEHSVCLREIAAGSDYARAWSACRRAEDAARRLESNLSPFSVFSAFFSAV